MSLPPVLWSTVEGHLSLHPVVKCSEMGRLCLALRLCAHVWGTFPSALCCGAQGRGRRPSSVR